MVDEADFIFVYLLIADPGKIVDTLTERKYRTSAYNYFYIFRQIYLYSDGTFTWVNDLQMNVKSIDLKTFIHQRALLLGGVKAQSPDPSIDKNVYLCGHS